MFDPDFAKLIDYIKLYRECGLQVVPSYSPIENKSWKRPSLFTWREHINSLVDEATFNEWFGPGGTHAKTTNIGIITGAASSNRFIIDLDLYKCPEAAAWWDHCISQAKHAWDLETPTQKTGGGGIQLLFEAPLGWIPPTIKTAIGVDIRGQGGFAVIAPSIHESGNHYVWIEGKEPWNIDISIAPVWLCQEIDKIASEHGGHTTSISREITTKSEFKANNYGFQEDGREDYMTRLVWAHIVDLKRKNEIQPEIAGNSRKIADDIFEVYERHVSSRIKDPKLSNSELLEREGRGYSLLLQKVSYALEQWNGKVAQYAAIEKKTPQEETNKFETSKREEVPTDVLNLFPIDAFNIPTRKWISKGLFLRSALTVLVAPPGSGKSLLAIHLAISTALGFAWGGWKPEKQSKTLIINSEDDLFEIQRRSYAACETMNVDQSELQDRVFILPNTENIVLTQHDPKSKSFTLTPFFEQLVKRITENQIDLIIVDPFADTFIGDENSNSEIKWAVKAWDTLAKKTNTCVFLIHHTKKYSSNMAGDQDSVRGGSAITAKARITSTFFTMTENEAVTFNIPNEERKQYIRYDDAKSSYAASSPFAHWFKKVSVSLPNGSSEESNDEVGSLIPWEPPNLFSDISTDQINRLLTKIDRGLLSREGSLTGERYTFSKSRKLRFVGTLIQADLEKSDVIAHRIMKMWQSAGLLVEREYTLQDGRIDMGIFVVDILRPGSKS